MNVCIYRGFTSTYKPLVTLKHRKCRLDFDRNPVQFPVSRVFGQIKPRWTHSQRWEEKCIENQKYITSSVKYGGHGHVWLPMELGQCLLIIWLFEVYRVYLYRLSAQIQLNTKLIGQCFTVQMNSDPKPGQILGIMDKILPNWVSCPHPLLHHHHHHHHP